MSTILETIISFKKAELVKRKQKQALSDLMQQEYFYTSTISLKTKLEASKGIIAEMKRKSPSAGMIFPKLDPTTQATKYQAQGACAISVLTDDNYFGGSLLDLQAVRKVAVLPILQKDFIIDEYQLFEAKANGADVVLLIAAALSKEKCLHLSIIAKSLNLEVILEIHAEHELAYIHEEIDFIMVNNRNLHLQQTNIQQSLKLRPYLPESILKISASGISTRSEVSQLFDSGYNALLIGESILKEQNLGHLTQKRELC